MAKKKPKDTTVNLEKWEVESRIGYLKSFGYNISNEGDSGESSVEVHNWNEKYMKLIKRLKRKQAIGWQFPSQRSIQRL